MKLLKARSGFLFALTIWFVLSGCTPGEDASRYAYREEKGKKEFQESAALQFRVLRLEQEMAEWKSCVRRVNPAVSLICSGGPLIVAEPEESPLIPLTLPQQPQETDSAALLAAQDPSATAKEEPEKEIKKEVAKKPAPAPSEPSVTGVRTGEHPGKTRLVLDLSAPGKFSFDIDNNEKLMTVTLDGLAWAAPETKSFSGDKLLKSYSITKASGGTTLVLELKAPVKPLASGAIGPEPGSGHRIFFDLGPL